MSHRTRRLSRRQQRLARVVSAARWQRRALRNADVPATRSLIDGDPETRQRLQTHFLGRERGAVLVEYAIILPLAVMLGVSGLFYGLGVLESIRLEHAATEAVHVHEDTAATLVEQAGGTLVCFWAGDGEGGCFPDELEGLDRVQVVAESVKTYQPPLGARIVPTARAVAVTS